MLNPRGALKMTHDLIDAIKERHCVRRFKPDPVPEATIGRLIESARCAPSAGNIQPWHFIVVLNERVRQELASAAFGQNFVAEAPVCIVIVAEPHKSGVKYGGRGERLYCIQDTAACAQNILLAAVAYGLGACWVGAFDDDSVRDALGLPAELRPVVIIPVGYPAEEGRARPTVRQEEVVEVVR
jgi:nitroreductase